MKHSVNLTEGSVMRHVWRMTPPMMMAFLMMMVFNLADTWFVSRLGTEALAAMGFTFPFIMIIHSLAMGLGLGISSCVSNAIGSQDHDRVKLLTTYGLLLAFLIMGVLSVAGYIILPKILSLLGAQGNVLMLSRSYLTIWIFFVPLGELPMVGNNAIRATGDTLRPSIIMAVAALLNIALDPLLIFGAGPLPAMGIEGAALATGLARVGSLCGAFWLLGRRCHLLTREWRGISGLLREWGRILHIALPSAATNLLGPISAGVITRLIAQYGEVAVAATAAGQRIEHFSYLVPMAMGSTLVPIIGQNWGAGRKDRVHEVWVKTNTYGIIYGVICLLLALPLARPVAGCFSKNPDVVHLMVRYLWIMLGASILQHLLVHTGFAFNAIRKPAQASVLTILRSVGLAVPFCWMGSYWFGVMGVYSGMAVSIVATGIVALLWFRKTMGEEKKTMEYGDSVLQAV